MSVARGTVHSIQFLRFVAAALVVIYHSFVGFVMQLPTGDHAQSDYWFRFGAVGVHVFFVISGYIMYLTNFGRPGTFQPGRFLVRRLIRVYPTYWTFVAIYLAIQAMLHILPVLTTLQFAGMLVLTPAEASRVIGPAWTLSFEIYFYLAFGVTMALGERRGLVILTVFFVGSIAVGAVLHPAPAMLALMTNSLLVEFLAGVWIAWATTRRVWPRTLGWLLLVSGIAGFAAGLVLGYDRLPGALAWGVPSALVIAGAVVLEQTTGDKRQGPIRRLSWLGDSSYSLYLCHTIIITLLVATLRVVGLPPLWPLIGVTTLGCIAIAALFYRTVERPMIGALHRLTERPRVRGA